MNRFSEKEYYKYLEKVIREQKAKQPFFHNTSQSYEIDIHMIMQHIMKKNPELAEKIFSNFVDTTQMKNASKQEVLRFVGRTEKGTVVKWKNEEGEEIYIVNNGQNFFTNTKRVLVLGSHLNKSDLNELKNTIYGAVLKKDVQHVYKKIQRDEQRKQKKGESLYEYFTRKYELVHTSSNFEKNFKQLVKEQGSTCIPFSTFTTMVTLMKENERKTLAKSFGQMGVRNNSDLEALLSKWKSEALHPEYVQQRKKKRTRTYFISHTR